MLPLFLAALFFAQAAPRGVAVTGVVQDQTGAVLTGASVTLSMTGAAAPLQTSTTDQSGAFRFDHVAAGEYDIRSEFPGFVTKVTLVRVGARAPGAVTIVLAIEG